MNKCYIKVKPLCEEPIDGKTLDDLKKSPLGKALQKLFDAGYVNTIHRVKTLWELHTKYSESWPVWDTITFGSEKSCKNVFYLHNSNDFINDGDGERVSLKYILNL